MCFTFQKQKTKWAKKSVNHFLQDGASAGIRSLHTSIVINSAKCDRRDFRKSYFKEVPLLATLTRNISSNFFPEVLSMCEYSLKKPWMLPTFQNGHFIRVCTERMLDHQYGENGATNIYSNYNEMRASVERSPNQ